ncbi:YjbH domain-containing protein [Rhodoferax sp.]|uniref:YjbH domain-containing protein n=1 Tax=Rhodoferax sp. TaxID=50421 RepID=UPI002634598A|nr:YjbH domain-containing protein [Rhodoferax sp.]MDD2808161.1 YjbH domain-containing protein [Rhodoferax sp.]MDD4944686.1 YjbH domain-containing protein [Rhodoferax sp.]
MSCVAKNPYGRVFCLTVLAFQMGQAQAQSLGINTQGVTGGLVIPYADVLSTGTLALTKGNYQEAQVGVKRSTTQNMSLGVGLLPGIEFSGRFAEYTDPVPNSIFFNGIRDISANLKVQLPIPWFSKPKVAVGVNDLSGGAVFFKSAYVVASDQYGPFRVALGYAKGKSPVNNPSATPTFDGFFRGVNVKLNDSGLSGLVEFEGPQKHMGLRWMSAPMTSLGNSQLIGNVQRSFGPYAGAGTHATSNHFAVSLVMPFGENEMRVASFEPSADQALPSLEAEALSPSGMQPTAQDQLESLRKALVNVGLERVRVGQHGPTLVVEYENHRYAHNEVDALGLVFGLGAEMAPRGTTRINAVTFKDGLRLYETAVGLSAFRAFLRDGPASHVRDSLSWDKNPSDMTSQTDWAQLEPGAKSAVRFEIKPDFVTTLGTEVGAFDYALAANLQANVPLWSGAKVYSSYLLPVDNTTNMESGNVLGIYKQRSGLKTVALQQSFWLGNQILSSVAAGKFNYEALGVQAEAAWFVPGTDDLVQLSGVGYSKAPGGVAGRDRAGAASYRHMLSPTMWLQAGAQRYSDGSTGPSVEWNRWFGDVGVQLFYRKGGNAQFAGFQLNIPLTPRQGMKPATAFFSGAPHYEKSIRTRLTSAGTPGNYIAPGAVTNLKLETSLELDALNAGRLSKPYLDQQVYRMREAFYMFTKTKK